MSIDLSKLSKLSQIQNGLKIDHALDTAAGDDISSKQKLMVKDLSSNVENLLDINNYLEHRDVSNEIINETLNKMNNNYKVNKDQALNTDEDNSQLTIEMNNFVDEINEKDEKVIILSENSKKISDNTYVKEIDQDIQIKKLTNDSIVTINVSTIPSNLESVEDDSCYSKKVTQLLSDNVIQKELKLNSDGPKIITKSALDITEKIEKENNFDEGQSKQFEEAVSKVLGVTTDELDDVKVIDKVEDSSSDTNKFYSYNELNNEDKEILSSNAIILETNQPTTIEINKTTNQLVKTNFSGQSVTSLLSIKPTRRMSFCTKRELRALASYLKYNKEEFNSAALKLRIKHHRVTNYAPVYKNGIYVRFAKRSDKLEKGEKFLTKKVKLIII